MRRPYALHEVLVAPARKHPEVFRLIGGLFLVGFVAISMNTMVDRLLRATVDDYDPAIWWQGSTPATMLAVLGSFGFIIVGTVIAVRYLHDRNPIGLIGPPALAIVQFWQVLKILIILSVVLMVLPPYDAPGDDVMESQLPLITWTLLLPFSMLALLIQVSAEEILFRGYMQQSLAARFNSPLMWLVVPSAVFGLAHYVPDEANTYAWYIALWAGVFALLMADLTARAGSLGPAIAIHFVNNFTAILVFSFPDGLNGLALFVASQSRNDIDNMPFWLTVDLILILISWLAARIAIQR